MAEEVQGLLDVVSMRHVRDEVKLWPLIIRLGFWRILTITINPQSSIGNYLAPPILAKETDCQPGTMSFGTYACES